MKQLFDKMQPPLHCLYPLPPKMGQTTIFRKGDFMYIFSKCSYDRHKNRLLLVPLLNFWYELWCVCFLLLSSLPCL